MSKSEELQAEYLALMHAVQSGVAMTIELGGAADTNPKHLRTGVNSAMVDSAALARLLIRKGAFSEEEWFASLVEVAREEVERYEERCRELLGRPVVLR